MRALVVEDDPPSRRLVTHALTIRGHEVVAFEDAESALAAYRDGEIEIAVLDFRLPGADGSELCRRLRALPGGERIAILIQTAWSDVEIRDAVLDAGADDFLAKPYAMKALDERIAIAEREARRAADQAAAFIAERERLAVEANIQRQVANLAVSIGSVLAGQDSPLTVANGCAQALARHFDGARVAIWLRQGNGGDLALSACAGRGARALTAARDGGVPAVVEWIARERRPYLSDTPAGDPLLDAAAWPASRRPVVFAGFPLLAGGTLFGVLTLDLRRRPPDLTLAALATIATGIAFGLARFEREAQYGSVRAGIEMLIRHVPDLVAITNEEGIVTFVSPSFGPVLGHRPQDLIGLDKADLFLTEDLPEMARAFAAVKGQPGASVTFTARSRHRDGDSRRFECVTINLLDDPAIRGYLTYGRDVTKRTATEAALTQEQQLLDALMNSLPDLIFFKDVESRFLRINPALATLWHLTDPAEAVGRNNFDFQPAEVAAAAVADDLVVMRAERPLGDQVDSLTDDASAPRWFSTTKAPVRDSLGQVIGVVGVARDITDRHRDTLALRTREAHLRRALAAGQMVSWELDLRTQRVSWLDSRGTPVGGVEERELTIADSLALVHPDDRARIEETRTRAIAEGGSYEVEYRILLDGETRWEVAKGDVISDDDGTPVRVIGIAMDISARKQAEAARRRQEQQLLLQAELLDQAAAAVTAWDHTGVVTHWNRHAELLYGWRRTEAIGRAMTDLDVCPTDPAVKEEIAQCLYVAGERWDGEYEVRSRTGETIPVFASQAPVIGPEGTPIAYVGVAVDLSERRAFEAKLAHQALHDALTGLPNRASIVSRLEWALGSQRPPGQKVALLFLDIDRFKRINDSFGHAAGDALLVAVTRRLGTCLRGGDTLARLGGDEFVVLLDSVDSPADAERIAHRLLERLRKPFVIERRETQISATVGIAISGSDLTRAEDLLRAADIAHHHAKETTTRLARYEAAMARQAADRLALEGELRRAIERQELRVHFQPKVDLRTGQIVGVEALVRWQHPTRGLLSPGDFIPLAEETGLIAAIDRWVLTASCRQLAVWRDRWPQAADLVICVNLSARLIQEPVLVDQVAAILRTTGLAPGALKLEITERTLVEDIELGTRTIQSLRALGVRLAIDDFGTGYSSFSYLQHWPVDTLKIDRSFVASLGTSESSRPLIGAMVKLASALRMDVTAEGIETAEQVRGLCDLGVTRGQGFYFARPLPAETLEMLLAEGHSFQIPQQAVEVVTGKGLR